MPSMPQSISSVSNTRVSRLRHRQASDKGRREGLSLQSSFLSACSYDYVAFARWSCPMRVGSIYSRHWGLT